MFTGRTPGPRLRTYDVHHHKSLSVHWLVDTITEHKADHFAGLMQKIL